MSRLVLLHGLGNSGAVWTRLLQWLPPGLEVHVPELPWSSTRIAQWRHETNSAARVEEVLAGLPGPVDVLVAHSFATIPVLELLSRRAVAGAPSVAATVVLVNPFYRPAVEDFHWGTMESLLSIFPLTMVEGIQLQSGRPIEAEVLAGMARRLCDWVGPYGWVRFLDGYLRTPLLRTDLIDLPCLVVGAEQDRAAPAQEARQLADALPGGRIRISRGGHFPMGDHPGWLAAVINDALDLCPVPLRAASGR